MPKIQRKISHINFIERHYIFCEGKVTEYNYFNSIKNVISRNAINRNVVNIETLYENANCDELIKKAKIEVEYRGIAKGNIWCVYDKDDFPDEKFNNAVKLANSFSNDNLIYHAIWSNICFEIWLLLHFEYYNSINERKNYFDKLDTIFKEKTGKKYNKTDDDIYNIINKYGSQNDAIKFAKKLLIDKRNMKPSNIVPGTKVYEIVEALNKYMD